VDFNPDHELARIRGRGRALPAVLVASLLLWALLLSVVSHFDWIWLANG